MVFFGRVLIECLGERLHICFRRVFHVFDALTAKLATSFTARDTSASSTTFGSSSTVLMIAARTSVFASRISARYASSCLRSAICPASFNKSSAFLPPSAMILSAPHLASVSLFVTVLHGFKERSEEKKSKYSEQDQKIYPLRSQELPINAEFLKDLAHERN